MNVFDLFARLVLDSKEYEEGLGNAEKQAEKVGEKIGNGLSTISKVGTAALTAGAAAVGALGTQAVKAYADFEQLSGGVETLFKDSSGIVMRNADKAFKTAGLSANQYMDTVTSFSASLLQSLGGDTEKAAEIADRAIIDMSDNANKMGTNISMIQNAYQGFAKQNYTMLDNLKLGYGGTKEEMERLLKDAQKLPKALGKKFNISNYSDIIEAIHLIQENMDITETTAKEAGTTISGSIGTMKAAWTDLTIAIANPKGNISKAVDNLVTSIVGDGTSRNKGVIGNLLPAIENALEGVGTLIEKLSPIIAEKLPGIIDTLLPPLISGAGQLINALLENAPQLIGVLIDAIMGNPEILLLLAPKLIGILVKGFSSGQSTSLLTAAGKKITSSLGGGIKAGGASINSSMGSVIGNLAIYTAAALAGAEIGKKMGEAIFPSDAELYEQYEGIMGTVRLLIDSIKAEIDLVGIFTEKARQAKREYGEGGLLEGLTDENYKTVISTVDNWVSVNGDLAHSLEDLTRRFNDGTLNAEYYRSSIASLIDGSEQFKGASDLTQKAIREWMDVEWVDYFANHFADAEDTVVNVATATEKASTSCAAYEEAARKGANALQGLYDANVSAVSSNEELEGSISEVDLTLDEFIEKITTEDWVSDWNYIKEGFDTTWALMQDSLTNAWQDVKDAFNFEEAITWGEDLINNFISGIQSKMGELETTVKGVAQTTKKYIGFSEPEEGPLSNFHTYAPDMMKLFAEGIRDNKHLVTDELNELNFNSSTKNGVLNLGNRTPNLVNNSRGQQSMIAILELDKTELGRVVYNLNNAENQRMGTQLAGGVL